MTNRYKRNFYIRLIIIGALLASLIFLLLTKISISFSETWSRTISRWYATAVGTLFSWIPFSITEVLIILLVIAIIIWIAFAIRHLVRQGFHGSNKYWLDLVIAGLVIGVLYSGTAGMNYNREPVDIPQHTALIGDVSQYATIGFQFRDDYNACAENLEFNEEGSVVSPYSPEELSKKIVQEYARLDSEYFNLYSTNPKQMYLLGWLYREFGITGLSFAPTGEANVNQLATAGERPFVCAHELAHSKGVMREEDANLTAAYICLTSDDYYLRYSGYMWTFGSLATLVRATNNMEDYHNLYKYMNQNIFRDNRYRSAYWTEHNAMSNIGNFFNNIYLAIAGNGGTDSYHDSTSVSTSVTPSGQTTYTINAYSPYQALYMWLYYGE